MPPSLKLRPSGTPLDWLALCFALLALSACNDPCDDAAEKLVFECAAQAPPSIGACESDREVCVADCVVDSTCADIASGKVDSCIADCASEE
jgi:hypothetical protein